MNDRTMPGFGYAPKWGGSKQCDFGNLADGPPDLSRSEGPPHDTSRELYDGKTTLGPWAVMCPDCFARWGRGLGVGVGQHYVRAPGSAEYRRVAD